MSIATLVLAAGGSTRMGRSKQLLEYREEALVRRAVRAAVEAELGPVIVVTGAERAAVEQVLGGLPVSTVNNDRWEEGMGSSIAAGVAAVEPMVDVSAMIIMLADQPMVDATVLRRLIGAFNNVEAAACRYGATIGVPAVFARGLFPRLAALPAGGGAKHILADGSLRLATIDFAGGQMDIDTPDDYRRLTGQPDGAGHA